MTRVGLLFLVAMAVVLSCLGLAGPAAATHVQCGDTITQDTTLDSDIIDCSTARGSALRIGSDGVSLDLGGHTVDGTGSGSGVNASENAGISVFNGRIQQFRAGVSFGLARDQVVRDLVVTQNFTGVAHGGLRPLIESVTATDNTTGINVSGGIEAVIRDNDVFGNQAGIGGGSVRSSVIQGNSIRDNVFGGLGWVFLTDSRIERNRVTGNGLYGITLVEVSARNVLVRNDASGNGEDGIVLSEDSAANTLERNRTDENGDDGIDVDGPGIAGPGNTLTKNTAFRNADLGMEVAPGNVDGGSNKARHNGNPAQCVGVTCK